VDAPRFICLKISSSSARHPGESRDPGQAVQSKRLWIPAFAGMTELALLPTKQRERRDET
jgi:hypothetical protein